MEGHKGKGIHMVTYLLMAIGGLNWLLFGLFGNELGSWVLGGMDSGIAKVVYILVGLATVYELATHKNCCKNCGVKGGDKPADTGGSPTPPVAPSGEAGGGQV